MQPLHFVTKEAKAKKRPRIINERVITKEQSQLVSEDTKGQKRMQDVTPTFCHTVTREKTLNAKRGLEIYFSIAYLPINIYSK